MKIIRELTDREKAALMPDLQVYIAGVQAAERIQRIASLLLPEDVPGAQLDINTLQIVVPDIQKKAEK